MTSEFAVVKFSGSPTKLGENKAKFISARSISMNARMSFREK